MHGARAAALAAVIAMTAACGTKTPPERAPAGPSGARDSAGEPSPAAPRAPADENAPAPHEPDFASGRSVRVALHTDLERVTIAGTGAWRLYDDNGNSLLVRAGAGDAWTIQAEHGRLRGVRSDGERTARRAAPFVARAAGAGAYVTVNGRPFRGEVLVRPGDHGLVVVNQLSLEDYLRGVVPLEIGRRSADERAAVEAQAIAARSYATAHIRPDAARGYDLLSTVSDQVYGGVEAEQPLADAAISATRSLVITWQGRVIAAPYSASCGGHTAGADEVWHEGDAVYLQGVSDRVRGSGDTFYCEIAPHFRWQRTLSRRELADVLERNLRTYASVKGKIGTVTDVEIDGRTASGRVGALRIVTDRGTYTLHGNEIRFALRPAKGEILPSTMFTVAVDRDRDAQVEKLSLTGFGNGHGVGMCQWGAIGRARAGANARAILKAYYPGTVVTALPE